MRRCPVPASIFLRARASFIACLAGVALFLRVAGAAEDPAANFESKIKAVLLVKLITYVDWPANAFKDSSTPFRIGILGDDPFGPLLEEVLSGEAPHGRTVQIRRATQPADLANCQLVFLGASEKDRLSSDLEAFRSKPVLMVSEVDQFARKGGMVGFTREKKSVRLEINIENCKQAGLGVSSRLASVARVVDASR